MSNDKRGLALQELETLLASHGWTIPDGNTIEVRGEGVTIMGKDCLVTITLTAFKIFSKVQA